jgi:hypothetical protein
MPARMDATGTRLSPVDLSRVSVMLLAAGLLLPTGCLAKRKPAEARGLGEPAAAARNTRPDDPPPEMNPPPPPTPGKTTSLIKDDGDSQALKRLARKAIEQEKRLGNYMCRIRRSEQVNGVDQPEEIILLKYRRSPLSVHCKWLGDEAKGREIVYVQGQHENQIHVLTGKGDLFGAGKRMTFASDSPLVRSKSRYPITEAGLGAAVLRFGALMDALERGQTSAGNARYLGLQHRPEFPKPVEAVEQTLPPGLEPFLPRGGIRYYYFDETSGLPTVVLTFDDTKHQVEYYHFDRVQYPINLDDSDFDPDVLWKR